MRQIDEAARKYGELFEVASELYDSLPKCTRMAWESGPRGSEEDGREVPCKNVATRARGRGGDRYCDDCADIEYTQASAMYEDATEVPEYPRAAALRKMKKLLGKDR